MADDLATNLLARLSSMKAEQGKWRSIWQSVAKYTSPNAAPIGVLSSTNRGARKGQPLDTVGIDCVMLLSAFIYSNTVYADNQWFDLKQHVARKEDEDRITSEFLQKLASKILDVVASSNFDYVYRQFLNGYVPFGTGAFFWELDENHNLFCKQWLISDNIYIDENAHGEIDSVFREFEYTARQAVQAFGYDNVSEEIKSAYADPSQSSKQFRFVHACYPREKKSIDSEKSTPENKPFADIYIEANQQKVVQVGGRDTFPYCISRFYNTGEVYGRSCAMNAIPALKAVSIATWAYLKNVEFNAKPMVFAPPQMYDKVKIESDTVNAWDSNTGDLKIWSPSGDMGSPLDFAEKKKDEVRRLFYVDRIQYLDDKKMTATEAQLRYDEMIQGFSPVLAALQSEFFTPFIEGLASELISRELITIPPSLRSEDGKLRFEVEYKSRLSAKLKGAFNANIITFTRLVAEYGQAKGSSPLAAAYLFDDKIIKTLAKNCNVLEVALNDDKVIEANIQAQIQQAQTQQLNELMKGNIKPIDTQTTPVAGSIMAEAIGNQ